MKLKGILVIVLVVLIMYPGQSFSADAGEGQTYTVQRGDTLGAIAQKFYNDRNLWPKLWEVNKNKTQNPHRLTVGDVLTIYPLETLVRYQAPPSPSPLEQSSLYDRGRPLDIKYPKYFTFLADPAGIGGTGIHRIKVKKINPLTQKVELVYDEVREVGEVIASGDRGYQWYKDKWVPGRLMLTYNDDVIIRFTDDLAKILDSATHEDPDPYFREFPVYGGGEGAREPNPGRADYGEMLGQLFKFRGRITVIARVETLAPVSIENSEDMALLTRRAPLGRLSGRNMDSEPVSYVAKITYSEHPIYIGDRVLVFKSLYPGPDREPIDPKTHKANQYRPTLP